MAAIWVVFGHSAVISNIGGQRISRIRTRDPRLPRPKADYWVNTYIECYGIIM